MQNHRLALMLHENALGYARTADPTDQDQARICRLIIDNMSLIAPSWQRAIVGIFAPLWSTPADLLDLFCNLSADVSAPFVATCPTLDDAMLRQLIDTYGAGPWTRAIARRKALSADMIKALRALNDPATDRALELRQGEPAEIHKRRIVPTERKHIDLTDNALDDIIELASDPSPVLFATALADSTGLSMTSARILCDDPTTRNMLFALRFMGLDTDRALTVFKALASAELAQDEAVQNRFRDAYETVTPQEAVHRVRGWQLDELASLARFGQDTDEISEERDRGAA